MKYILTSLLLATSLFADQLDAPKVQNSPAANPADLDLYVPFYKGNPTGGALSPMQSADRTNFLAWLNVPVGWKTDGNATLTDENKLGTLDAIDLNFLTNGSEQMSLLSTSGSFQYAPDVSNPTIDIALDALIKANHGYGLYDACFVSSTGTLPAPLIANTRYFIVSPTANDFKLSATAFGAAINLTTAGTGTIKVYANRWGSTGYYNSFVVGSGNALTTVTPYASKSIILGGGNTASSLGYARIFGNENTVTGGFGTAYIMGNSNGQSGSRGTINSGNGTNATLGSINSGGGQSTVNTGYHNDIDVNAQGSFTMGGGVDADWWGCLTRHSHASNGGFCRVIGELSAATGTVYPGGDLEINFTSIAAGAAAVPNTRLCNSGFGVMSADFNFLIVELVTGTHMVAKRRVTWRQPAWTQGVGNSQDVTADNTTDLFTFAAHGFTNGQTVYVTSFGTVPTGIPIQGLFVVNATANTFQLSLTSGGAAINFTNNGTSTINVSQVPPPVIIAIEVPMPDIGSNAGLPPAGWSLRIAPFNRRFVSGQIMYNNAASAGTSSFPYLNIVQTTGASAPGIRTTVSMDCNVMKF